MARDDRERIQRGILGDTNPAPSSADSGNYRQV
jgi:hypothetical protein